MGISFSKPSHPATPLTSSSETSPSNRMDLPTAPITTPRNNPPSLPNIHTQANTFKMDMSNNIHMNLFFSRNGAPKLQTHERWPKLETVEPHLFEGEGTSIVPQLFDTNTTHNANDLHRHTSWGKSTLERLNSVSKRYHSANILNVNQAFHTMPRMSSPQMTAANINLTETRDNIKLQRQHSLQKRIEDWVTSISPQNTIQPHTFPRRHSARSEAVENVTPTHRNEEEMLNTQNWVNSSNSVEQHPLYLTPSSLQRRGAMFKRASPHITITTSRFSTKRNGY